MRRPGVPWTVYAEGAALPHDKKLEIVARHDQGERTTAAQVRQEAAGVVKPASAPKELKSALATLIESRGEEFVSRLLSLASSGALDALVADSGADSREHLDGHSGDASGPDSGDDSGGRPEGENFAKNGDFPSKHCSVDGTMFGPKTGGETAPKGPPETPVRGPQTEAAAVPSGTRAVDAR